MLEAIIPLLSGVAILLEKVQDVVITPSKENAQKMTGHFLEIEKAYRTFEIQMSKAKYELEQGKIENLRNEVSKYSNAFDESFMQVISKGDEIARDIKAYSGDPELISEANKILQLSKSLHSAWLKLGEAIRRNEARHIRGFFNYVVNEVKSFVTKTKQTAQITTEKLVRKALLVKKAEATISKEQTNTSSQSHETPPPPNVIHQQPQHFQQRQQPPAPKYRSAGG